MNHHKIRRMATVGVITLLTVVLAVFVTRTAVGAFRPHLYAGTVLQGDFPAAPMNALKSGSGLPVDLGEFEDQVLLVYFGYTNCPDVCPTTLSAAADAIANLSKGQQDRTNLVMVSVDPARDTPAFLQEYVTSFHPRFQGATGDPADIERIAGSYGVFYELGEGTVESGYVVDHTAALMGIGTDGVLRIVWPPDISADALRGDLNELLG